MSAFSDVSRDPRVKQVNDSENVWSIKKIWYLLCLCNSRDSTSLMYVHITFTRDNTSMIYKYILCIRRTEILRFISTFFSLHSRCTHTFTHNAMYVYFRFDEAWRILRSAIPAKLSQNFNLLGDFLLKMIKLVCNLWLVSEQEWRSQDHWFFKSSFRELLMTMSWKIFFYN